MLTDEIKEDCSCSVAVSGGFDAAETDLSEIVPTLDIEDKATLYQYIRDNSCRIEAQWRKGFVERFEIADSQLPPDQGKDEVTLVTECVGRYVAATDDATRSTIEKWTQMARSLNVGIGVARLVFAAPNGFGIVFSPFGSFEAQHKWGVVSEIYSPVAFDHTWCETLADCCLQLEFISTQ